MSESDQFLRDVNEEVKREQQIKFWKFVAPYVITAALIIVAITAGTVGWQSYRDDRDRAWGERYSLALQLASEGNVDLAIDQFRALSSEASSNSGYAALAMIQEASFLAGQGQFEAAAALYQEVLTLVKDPALRDFAALSRAFVQLDTVPVSDLRALLEPLTLEDNPWRFSALELLAYVAGRDGDTLLQAELFTKLIDDPLTPSGIYGRSKEMMSILGEETSSLGEENSSD